MLPSIKAELLKYGENTSIRGIPKFFKSKDIFLKILWLLFFLASTAVLIYLLIILFTKFYSWPVTTKYGERLSQSTTFPDITICNLDPFAEGEPKGLSADDYFDLLEKIDKTVTKMMSNASYDERTRALISISFDELNSAAGYIVNLKKNAIEPTGCPNFVVDCAFFGSNWFESDIDCSNDKFTKIWNANYYTCYTLQTSKLNGSSGTTIRGLSLLLNVGPPNIIQMPYKSTLTNSQARGVQVSVHSPGTPPDPKRGFNVAPGTENIVEIIQTDITRLDAPYNKLGCTQGKSMPDSTSDNYTQDLCLEYCQQQIIHNECNCMLHLLSVPRNVANKVELCGNMNLSSDSLSESSSNYDNNINGLSNLLCALDTLYSDALDDCQLKCLVSCSETSYDTYVTSSTWPQPSVQSDIFKRYIFNQCESNPNVKSRFASYYDYYEKQINNSVAIPLSNFTQIPESFLEIKFVIKQNFPYYQSDNPAYTWDVMIGTVGGMLSLWLGITAASGVEIIELVYLLFKCCWQRNKSAPKAEENSKEVAEDIDANQPAGDKIMSAKHLSTSKSENIFPSRDYDQFSRDDTDSGQLFDNADYFQQFYINNGSRNRTTRNNNLATMF